MDDCRLCRRRADRAGRRARCRDPPRNPVHAALSLVATLFGVAVLFIAQDAQFLAAVQVIVYAGAIVVLFLFVIMLLGVDRSERPETEPLAGQRRPLGIAGVADRRRRPARRGAGAGTVTGARRATAKITTGRPQRQPARPAALHRLPVRLRDHSVLLVDRRRRCGGAGPPLARARPRSIDGDERRTTVRRPADRARRREGAT